MSVVYVANIAATVPMDPYDVEQFLYRHSLDGPDTECGIDISTGYHDYRIEWGTDFRLANRLMQRISGLGDLRDTFKAWCRAQEHCTATDALRASYHMNSVDFYLGVNSDEMLGEHALDNDIFYEYSELDADTIAMLDRAKVGARMREMDGGRFVEGGYLVAGEDFSGEPLPAEEPVAFFQVRFSDEHRDSGWCDVPLSEDNVLLIVRVVGSEDLSGLPIESRSILPFFNGIISGADELPELNLLNEALTAMSDEDIQKYKALLEVIQPGTPSTALRLADDLPHYDVEPQFADPEAYGRQYIEDRYSFNEYDSLLPFIDYAGFGAAMLKEDGYQSTRYGAVYMNVMAMKYLAGPNTYCGGDYYCGRTEGFPTYVCWDPDAQKVWLELSEGTADNTPFAELLHYQRICEDWGVRHCASQEDYNQIINDLGAQLYDEAMAEDHNITMEGMS